MAVATTRPWGVRKRSDCRSALGSVWLISSVPPLPAHDTTVQQPEGARERPRCVFAIHGSSKLH